MILFKVNIGAAALADVQNALDFYNEMHKGLDSQFLSELDEFIEALRKNPYYKIRYDEVRCLPLKKFPFMIHFTIDETGKTVNIRAILHTARNPKSWRKGTL